MYTPRKTGSIDLLLSGHVGHSLGKPASDGTRGHIVLWGSIASKPISVDERKDIVTYKIAGILAEHLEFLQPLKARKVDERKMPISYKLEAYTSHRT